MKQIQIEVDSRIIKAIPKLEKFWYSNNRFNVMYGGRGGGKSWVVADILIFAALQKKTFILCTREIQNTIKESVLKLLSDRIDAHGLHGLFEIKRDEVVCMNGSRFIFKGLRHNVDEIKSMEGVDICWIEEAHSVSRASLDTLIPTIRKEGSIFFITFNPREKDAPIYTDFVLDPRPGSLVEKVNWNDNPYFPKVLLAEKEYCKKFNYEKYLHIWEGNPQSISDSCIFNGKFESANFPMHAGPGIEYMYGADWGFAKDPSVLVRCYEYNGDLYIDKEAYGVGVEIEELPAFFATVPAAKTNKIIADSARPETISFMNNHGYVMRPASKGPDSVREGIEFIRSFKRVYIHEECKNTLYEFMNYSYKTDKMTGEVLPIPLDKDNHCIDALRYALEGYRKYGNIKARWI